MNQLKRRTGRPPKVEGRLNTELVALRLDDLLYKCVLEESKEAGFKDIQDYIREVLTARVFEHYLKEAEKKTKYGNSLIDETPKNLEPLINFYDDHYRRLNAYFDYLATWKDSTRRAELRYERAKGEYYGELKHRKKFVAWLKEETKKREEKSG